MVPSGGPGEVRLTCDAAWKTAPAFFSSRMRVSTDATTFFFVSVPSGGGPAAASRECSSALPSNSNLPMLKLPTDKKQGAGGEGGKMTF